MGEPVDLGSPPTSQLARASTSPSNDPPCSGCHLRLLSDGGLGGGDGRVPPQGPSVGKSSPFEAGWSAVGLALSANGTLVDASQHPASLLDDYAGLVRPSHPRLPSINHSVRVRPVDRRQSRVTPSELSLIH